MEALKEHLLPNIWIKNKRDAVAEDIKCKKVTDCTVGVGKKNQKGQVQQKKRTRIQDGRAVRLV